MTEIDIGVISYVKAIFMQNLSAQLFAPTLIERKEITAFR